MRIIHLERFAYTPMGAFGRMVLSDDLTFFTIERPWQHNQPNISCIPAGCYTMKKDDFQGKYPNYKVLDVPSRWAIELHRANVASDLQGCIGIGSALGYVKNQWAVTNSESAMTQFMTFMNGDEEAILHIFNESSGYI